MTRTTTRGIERWLWALMALVWTLHGCGGSEDDDPPPMAGTLASVNLVDSTAAKSPLLDQKGNARTLWVYYPKAGVENNGALVIGLCDAGETSAEDSLRRSGLAQLAEANKVAVVLGEPLNGAWETTGDNDIVYLDRLNTALNGNYLIVDPASGAKAINDPRLRYYVGRGTGATLLNRYAAARPANITAVQTFGGELPAGLVGTSEVPAWIVNGATPVQDFYKGINRVAATSSPLANAVRWQSATNRALQVLVSASDGGSEDRALVAAAYSDFFIRTRRWTGVTTDGTITDNKTLDELGFTLHVNDRSLGDNRRFDPQGVARTWYEAVPAAVKADIAAHPDKTAQTKVPLVLVLHGGGQTPYFVAQQTRFHELGETERFITVYPDGSILPTATGGNSYNTTLDDAQIDDVEFLGALIERLKTTYPIDATRIYIAGFSNGSMMAQAFAATRPQLIAAVAGFSAEIQVTFPNYPEFPSSVEAKAALVKARYDYRMPMLMFLGTKDVPPFKGAVLPLQESAPEAIGANFWKRYDNIAVKTIPAGNTYVAGIPGDRIETFGTDGRFTMNKFYTLEGPAYANYFNFTTVYDMNHAVDLREPALAWTYWKRFSRLPDGSLGDTARP